jgi:hypothetical protein
MSDIAMFHQLMNFRVTISQRDELFYLAGVVESRRSCATRHSRIRGLLVMVAEVRKRVAQIRICGGVPTGVLPGHALRLSNERLQIVDSDGPVHSKLLLMRTMSEIAIFQQSPRRQPRRVFFVIAYGISQSWI